MRSEVVAFLEQSYLEETPIVLSRLWNPTCKPYRAGSSQVCNLIWKPPRNLGNLLKKPWCLFFQNPKNLIVSNGFFKIIIFIWQCFCFVCFFFLFYFSFNDAAAGSIGKFVKTTIQIISQKYSHWNFIDPFSSRCKRVELNSSIHCLSHSLRVDTQIRQGPRKIKLFTAGLSVFVLDNRILSFLFPCEVTS